MKTLKRMIASFISAAMLVIGLTSAGTVNEARPVFYTNKGQTPVNGEVDCSSINDMLVKTPLPESAFKYDKLYMTVELTLGPSENDIYIFCVPIVQKKFNIQYAGKKEATFWIANPANGGKGDFYYQNDYVKLDYLCGGKGERKMRFWITGYIETSVNEYYNENTGAWEKEPVYDEGTNLVESDIIILKQKK